MKVLLSWLKDFVEISVSPEELERKLFSVGLEVESVDYLGEGIEKVCVGEIASLEKIENTHLYLCHVNCGEHGDDLVILTGADNVFEGAKVPVCLVGAKLPGGIEITPRKMSGIVSYGMLCSGKELGLDEKWHPNAGVNGIMILDKDAEPGEDIVRHLGLDDYLFDISVTANRPDCQSVLGIAREVSAFLSEPLREPDMSYTCDDTVNPDISVRVEAPDLCPRYLSHYVYDIKNAEAPLWMKRRLIAVGHNSINALVDITNYVLVEIGQPMHSFDLSTLDGSSLIIRRARDGEKTTTLDGQERILNSNNLLICDENKPACIAGVMGSLASGTQSETTGVLLESAKFLKDNIRKTSRGLGLQSDAASRFEKGIDEYTVECGMARALNLIQQLDIAKVSGTYFDINSGEGVKSKKLLFSVDKIGRILGIDVPKSEILRILNSLNLTAELSDGVLSVTVPPYREDIGTHQDIAEEIIREYGYDNVVPTFLRDASITNGGMNQKQLREKGFKEFLCALGYCEIQTIAMISDSDFDQYLIPKDSSTRTVVELLNPITEKLSIMRTFLTSSMVRVLERNIKSGNSDLRFFELANVYIPKSLPLTEGPDEIPTLCIGSVGKDESIFSVKETLESIAMKYGVDFTYKRSDVPFLHPGRCGDIYCQSEYIGFFGQLRYEIIDSLSIPKDKKSGINIYVAEINYRALEKAMKKEIAYTEPSPYNSVSRDISVIIDRSVECGRITETIYSAESRIKSVKLFDVFENERFGPDKKSMAFSILIADDDKDISDKEADSVMNRIVEELGAVYGAEMRA